MGNQGPSLPYPVPASRNLFNPEKDGEVKGVKQKDEVVVMNRLGLVRTTREGIDMARENTMKEEDEADEKEGERMRSAGGRRTRSRDRKRKRQQEKSGDDSHKRSGDESRDTRY